MNDFWEDEPGTCHGTRKLGNSQRTMGRCQNYNFEKLLVAKSGVVLASKW
jgi:hypothetical protein